MLTQNSKSYINIFGRQSNRRGHFSALPDRKTKIDNILPTGNIDHSHPMYVVRSFMKINDKALEFKFISVQLEKSSI